MKPLNELEADFLFENIVIINQTDEFTLKQKFRKLNIVFLDIINTATAKKEKQIFPTWLAKINFVIQANSLEKTFEKKIFLMQRIMRLNVKKHDFEPNKKHWAFCLALTSELIEILSSVKTPENILSFIQEYNFDSYNLSITPEKKINELRALFIQEENQFTDEQGRLHRNIICKTSDYGDIKLLLSDVIFYLNEQKNFTYPLAKDSLWLQNGQEFLLTQVIFNENNFASDDESLLIFTPDYLIDVTKLSTATESIDNFSGYYAFLDRFIDFDGSEHTMLGNVVNSMLDKLIYMPEVDFKQAFESAMEENVLDIVKFDNNILENATSKLQIEFENIKKSLEPFKNNQLITEPSFISAKNGLQGRLDVLVEFDENPFRKDIIELKSTRITEGVLANFQHKIQVACYNLLLDSNFERRNGNSIVLYSRDNKAPLRNLGKLEYEKRVAMMVRNQLVTLDFQLANRNFLLFEKMEKVGLRSFKNDFTKRKFARFAQVFQQADEILRTYFLEFCSFIAREMMTAKLGGVQETEPMTGFSSLWLLGREDKKDNFSMLDKLIVKEFIKENSILTLKRPQKGISIFRNGDLILLYPCTEQEANPLKQQMLKGTILSINNEEVVLKLNHKFIHDKYFKTKEAFAIEANSHEKGFKNAFEALYQLLKVDKDKLQLFFGLKKPQFDPNFTIDYTKEGLNEAQNEVLRKALSAKDYFLLQGPPGTGKTSKMLRNMVHFLFNQTQETVVLLAFTNRATDEICEKLVQVCGDDFIRLGNTAGKWSSHTIKGFPDREKLREKIKNCKVFVGTVASFPTYKDFIKNKDTLIVDEASQLLEPHLCGILNLFKRFILIGDEKQLPAVVTQEERFCEVQPKILQNIGMKQLSTSLFERLLRNAKQNQWNDAYEMLKFQYRTHNDIVSFINLKFYHALQSALEWQYEPFLFYQKHDNTPLAQLLCSSRLIFIESEPEQKIKVNQQEARFVRLLVQKIKMLKSEQFNENLLGIITPYRAQIAEIDSFLSDSERKNITVDTVERFQGSERDIIIISMAVNQPKMMQNVQSLDIDKLIDKKLNVALSRAKQQIIILGNENIMRNAKYYADLLDFIKLNGIFVKVKDFMLTEEQAENKV